MTGRRSQLMFPSLEMLPPCSDTCTNASTEGLPVEYPARHSREHSNLLLAYAGSPASRNNSGRSQPPAQTWRRYWFALAKNSEPIKQREALQEFLRPTV